MQSQIEAAAAHQVAAPARFLTPASILILFGLNAYICENLFQAHFIDQMGSTAGPFIAISRWMMRHWHDLSWYPLWFTGMPFFRVYPPGLHVVVAAAASLFRLTPERSYFLVIALVYCLQPVTLYWLCYRASGFRSCAFAAGLAFSLISPSAFLASLVRHELGGIWFARRYHTLVYYGEAPHDAVLLLIPLAILFLHQAAVDRKRWFFPLACLVLAAVFLTNWPGSVGLMMALLAYGLSRVGADSLPVWLSLAASGAIAFAMVGRWIEPASLLPILRNAQQSDGTSFGWIHLLIAASAILILLGLHRLFQRFGVDRWLRFFMFFAFISGLVALTRFWTGFNLLPQGHRWQLEMEMAIIGAIVLLARPVLARLPFRVRIVLLALLALGALLQVRNYYRYAQSITHEVSPQDTIEYRASKWIEANFNQARVFVPGSVSLWLDAFTDVPQVGGCCDPSVPSFSHRLALYTIYTGENAGDRYIPAVLLWLQAYGAQAILITGPNSSEFFKPYARPDAFRNALPELWRDGDNVIYKVPSPSPSLAHVLDRSELVHRQPANGLDTAGLAVYVAGLERAGSQAEFQWINPHQARVRAQVAKGQIVSVQISYDPGWRATISGIAQPIRGDALGLMQIQPACTGSCDIDLVFDPGRHLANWAQMLGLILAVVWPFLFNRAQARRAAAERPSRPRPH
ncbi:MAG TPA: hypothetical protein VMH05_00385 [Bryobacteraceae bacterium]|nr:hypothetical protein [Bryobacteraceae bacterium]